MAVGIKVCGITLPEQAKAISDMGADYLGTIVYEKSPRHVPYEALKTLLPSIPESKRILVDVAPSLERLQCYWALGYHAAQLHFDPEAARGLVPQWCQLVGRGHLWLAPRIKPEADFPEYLFDYADTFVLDTYKKDAFGGTGETGGWERFKAWKAKYPNKRFILAGGLSPENLQAAIATTGTTHVDLNSGFEISPGIKDLEKVRGVLC
ncbi:MAG: phosphoribosylanthranilate isomerase [Opitutales bacterium]|nr:phosphoribosylanthranilate isomerase [Opitutales bacterium]